MDTQKLSSTGIGFVFAFECTPYDEYYTSATPSPVSRSSCDTTFLSPQHAQSQATTTTQSMSPTSTKLQYPLSSQHIQPQATTIVSATLATQNTATTTNHIGDQTQQSHKHELTPLTSTNTFNNSLSPSHINITPLTPLNTPLTAPTSKNTAVSPTTTNTKNQSSKKQSKLKKKKNLIFRGGNSTSSSSNNTKRVEVSPRFVVFFTRRFLRLFYAATDSHVTFVLANRFPELQGETNNMF